MHGLQEGHRDQNRPGNLHQKKALHRNVWCFFVAAKRVRVWLSRESAVHGPQEGHRDQNRPGNLHKKALYFVGSMVLFFLLKPVFGGLHCFACTVFRFLQAVPIHPPTFDFTPFSKRNVLNKSGIQLF